MFGRVEDRIVRLALFAVMWATPLPSSVQAQETEASSAAGRLDAALDRVAQEVARLDREGKAETAAELQRMLEQLRSRRRGPYFGSGRDELEVHAVAVEQGSAAPQGLLTGKQRFTTGYAEAHVTYTERPLILWLMSRERVYWQLRLSEDADVRAVVLTGHPLSEVAGLLEETLVVRPGRADRVGSYRGHAPDQALLDRLSVEMLRYTGRKLATYLGERTYGGQPIIVGPENDEWRAQHLLSDVQMLTVRAERLARERQSAKLASLRFPAAYFTMAVSSEGYPGPTSAASGDFSMQGPIASTLEPVSHGLRHWVTDAKEKLQFGIDAHWQFVFIDGASNQPAKVPIGVRLERPEMSCLALDRQRRRLVLGTHYGATRLLAFDLDEAKWSELRDPAIRLAALTYDTQEDVFYGLTRTDPHMRRNERAELVRIGCDGQLLKKWELSEPVQTHPADTGGAQLVPVEKWLIAVTPPLRDEWDRYVTRLFVLDRQSGDVVYSGPVQPHGGKRAPSYAPLPPPPLKQGLLAQLFGKLAEAERRIAVLEDEGDKELAGRLAQRLNTVRSELAGRDDQGDAGEPELHVVGFYDAQGARVKVTDTTRPIVLALCSYDPAEWNVEVAEGVELKRVIVGGYHRQSINGLPDSVPLEVYTHDDRTGGFYTYESFGPKYDLVRDKLHEFTSLNVTTFHGSHDYKREGRPIVIGPQDAAWRAKRAVVQLDTILHIAGRKERAEQRAKLEGLRFPAVFYQHEAGGGVFGRGAVTAALAEFTPQGPIVHSLRPLVKAYPHIVECPDNGQYYAISGHSVVTFDPKSGTEAALQINAKLPRLSWPCGLAYDSRRKRLLLASLGGVGHLYAYSIEDNSWSLLRDLANKDLSGLTYDPDRDLFYGLQVNHDGTVLLHRLNAKGTLLSSTPVEFTVDRSHPFARLQLAMAGRYVAVIHQLSERNAAENKPPVLSLVEGETGRMLYSSEVRPHPGFRDLTAKEYEQFWERLADENQQVFDRAIWELAAGRDETVTFFAQNLESPPPADAEQIRELVRQLDDDRFEVREQATRRLEALGPSVEKRLLEVLQQNPSGEVRVRIQAIAKRWSSGETSDPQLRRQLRAIKVLEHIQTPKAVRLLEELAGETPGSTTARAAKQALGRLNQSNPRR